MSAVAPFLVAIPTRTTSVGGDTYARASSVDATTVVEINLGIPYAKVGLARIKIKRVSGAAANFTPRIFSKAATTTAGDISEEYAGAATAVADLFDPSVSPLPVVMQADVNGKLYLVFAPDAGADNVFDYALRFYAYR